jgi:chromosome segregation ATPase
MFKKLKEVVSLSDEIRELKNILSTVQKELAEIKNQLGEKSKDDSDSRQKEAEEIKQLTKEITKVKDEMRNVSREYSLELNAFRITKKNIQEKLYEEFSSDTKKLTLQMSTYLQSYKNLESQMNQITIRIMDFSSTIKTLKSLAEEVSKKDFELKNYAQILNQNDHEKVELLKKIDSLERLMSAMKRSKRPHQQV